VSKGKKILIGVRSHWFVNWSKFQVRGVALCVFFYLYRLHCASWLKLHVICQLRTVSSKFLGFSQKPPGGSIPTARRHISDEFCSCFGLNRLAAMNSCQAARLRSRSLLMFVAISVSAYVFFCDWCEWVLLDIFLDQIGLSNCGMVRVEGWSCVKWFGVAHEGEYRAAFMKQIESRKLVCNAGMVVSWWLKLVGIEIGKNELSTWYEWRILWFCRTLVYRLAARCLPPGDDGCGYVFCVLKREKRVEVSRTGMSHVLNKYW